MSQSSVIAQRSGAVTKSLPPEVAVPFIGCESSGQTEVLAAPKGVTKFVRVAPKDAQALAYYESADGIGLLAPRGWHCVGRSGSGGWVLYLAPEPFSASLTLDLSGPAIEVDHMTSENSGKFYIADIMVRVFPTYKVFGTAVLQGMGLPIPPGPYPKDVIIQKRDTIVEYTTPALTEGLGNAGTWLRENDLPIKGAAIIVGNPPGVFNGPDLVLLSARLSPALSRLIPAIVSQCERDEVDAARK
jgi:hypothetical protein